MRTGFTPRSRVQHDPRARERRLSRRMAAREEVGGVLPAFFFPRAFISTPCKTNISLPPPSLLSGCRSIYQTNHCFLFHLSREISRKLFLSIRNDDIGRIAENSETTHAFSMTRSRRADAALFVGTSSRSQVA